MTTPNCFAIRSGDTYWASGGAWSLDPGMAQCFATEAEAQALIDDSTSRLQAWAQYEVRIAPHAKIDTSAMARLGYTVTRPEEGRTLLAYVLTGKRLAVYGLMRYRTQPEMMFAVRARTGVICSLKGNYNFTDEGGVLRPVS